MKIWSFDVNILNSDFHMHCFWSVSSYMQQTKPANVQTCHNGTELAEVLRVLSEDQLRCFVSFQTEDC